MNYDVIVSGYVSLDRVIKITDTMSFGKTSLVTNHEHLHPEYGGCGINFAVDLVKLGLSACPIIRVGNDYQTSGFQQYLQTNHIPEIAISQVENVGTSCSYLVEDNQMNHVTLYYPGAMDANYFQKYQDEWFTSAKIALMTVASYPDNYEFYEKAKKANIPLYLGLKLDKSAFPETFLDLLAKEVNGIFANEMEYLYLLEATDSFSYKDLFFLNPQLHFLVVTKGQEGSVIYYKDQDEIKIYTCPIVKTSHFVSSVGSGDAFMAGFIFGQLTKESMITSMKFGAASATFAIEGKGATSNAPTKEELIQRVMKEDSL